jgi:predicted ATPase
MTIAETRMGNQMPSMNSPGNDGDLVERKDLRFTRLALNNWRNFTSVDVGLQLRMFLVGPNASGKSNLLDSFRFLSDIVTVGGGFQAAVSRRGGVSMLRSFAARRYPAIRIHVTLGNERFPNEWDYTLAFTQDSQRRPRIESEIVLHRGKRLLERPDSDDENDPDRLRQTHLEQVNVNRNFRDVADFFASVRYMHVVPQLVREPDRSVGHSNDPFGGDFLEQIARTNKRTRDSRLKRIVEALRVAVPQLQEVELNTDVRGVPHLRGRYQHWRPYGAWQSEEHFSDGTLRLLGLLWAVTDGTGPLLLEEPELSLHPEVVRYIPQMFARVQRRSKRQILVSSHSPEILNDPGIGLDEVLVLIPQNEGTLVKRLADDPQAENMHAAGIELSEILGNMTRPPDASQLSLFAS